MRPQILGGFRHVHRSQIARGGCGGASSLHHRAGTAARRYARYRVAGTERLFDGPFYLSPLPQRVPACHLVFVQSLDGNTGARNPQTLGGGETDKHLIYEGLARVSADAVLAGCPRFVAGAWSFPCGIPSSSDCARLSASRVIRSRSSPRAAVSPSIASFSTIFPNIPALRVVLLTAPGGIAVMREALAERPWITPIVVDTGHRLIDAFEQLRAMGVQRISAVGGRSLAAT